MKKLFIAFVLAPIMCSATDINDLLKFLSLYGTNQSNVTPAWNNYYQDINVGGSDLGNLSLVDGQPFFIPATEANFDTLNYGFSWYVNDVLQTTKPNPKLIDFANIDCDGVVLMKLIIQDLNTGVLFQREEYAYLGFNNIVDCNCLNCPSQFDVFYTFYPSVPQYHYQVSFGYYDYNQNNTYEINDLLVLLSLFGN